MNTPLTDNLATYQNGSKVTVEIEDCRAIELRLNECVEVLGLLVSPHTALCGFGPRCHCDEITRARRKMVEEAIANAKKPLTQE